MQNQTTGPKPDMQLTQPEATTPGEIGKPTTASRPADTPQRVLLTERDTPMDSGVKPGITPDTARGNPDMVPAKPETAPQIQPEMEKPDIAQDVPKTRTGAPRLTTDLRTEADVNTDADSAVTPVSYEDALRDYLGKGTEPSAVLNTDADAESAISQEAVAKTKEQIISELAPKIRTTNMTPGRALIAAQEMYAEVEHRYGQDTDRILEMILPGQDPRKFLDGFQNAYLSGKMGSGAALKNSSVATYLTEEQRQFAYKLGETPAQKSPAGMGPDNSPGSIPPANPEGKKTDLLSTLKDGTIEEKCTAFKKAFQEGEISTRISSQKQAGHIWGTKQFWEQEAIMAKKGDHPSYLREDISESDLKRIVIPKLRGELTTSGKRTCEFVLCDEVIGYYYSKAKGGYVETRCAQVIYAVAKGNIHIVPVKNLLKD